ncbi:MAG: hypothetical protein KBS69_01780 [Bacteroidales bacterium]|nr:hypothetical protein [Candidatus Colicola caccequi]
MKKLLPFISNRSLCGPLSSYISSASLRSLLFILCYLLFSPSSLAAANRADSIPVFQGCSGGMLVHAGYLFGSQKGAPVNPEGMTIGIGGVARVNLWKHLRIGGEGYISTMYSTVTSCHNQLSQGSYVRTGWGGLLVDACWRLEKVWPYIGATIGGGASRYMYVLDGSQNDWQPEKEAYLNKQPFFAITPFVGTDWCVSPKIHLTFRLDWLIAIHHSELVQPTGPRLYLGVLFCH